jgi:hypothetical protein
MKAAGRKSGKKIESNAAGATKRQILKRKNLILDQTKIDRAKQVLGVATEIEAITRALDAVNDLAAFQAELDRGFDDLIGRGGFVDRFGSTSR